MNKLLINYLNDSNYYGIITILDYEFRLSNCLKELSFAPSGNSSRKILVDLALKTGMNSFRFVEFELANNGKIRLSSSKYVIVEANLEKIANGFLQLREENVKNSILTESKKKEILLSAIWI